MFALPTSKGVAGLQERGRKEERERRERGERREERGERRKERGERRKKAPMAFDSPKLILLRSSMMVMMMIMMMMMPRVRRPRGLKSRGDRSVSCRRLSVHMHTGRQWEAMAAHF